MSKVYPVILSGGSGTRLWPKSRTLFPKQFHALTSDLTLLQEALERVKDPELYANPIVVCNEDHRFIVAEQADEIGVKLESIVLEPEGRNTAPAVAVAAAIIRKLDPQGLVLVLASDHHIGDVAAFTAAVRLGVPAAVNGYICTFGINPICPETGYGYIKRTSQEVSPGVFKIDQFKEKPNLETAKVYIADSSYAWNAGLFLFSAESMLQELDKYEPSIRPACENALQNCSKDDFRAVGFLRLNKEHFQKAKAMSLDYAIMERTAKSGVIPLDAAWTDVGSWPSLYQTCLSKPTTPAADKQVAVYTRGTVDHTETRNCFLSTDGPLLATIGIEGLCVIATEDAVLVMPMDKSQEVGALAKRLLQMPKTSTLAKQHREEYKPWGSMKTLAAGDGFLVLQLTLNPGAATSRQMHFHRAMHQVIVRGSALLTHGDETMLLHENQSFYIPIGVSHRLENPGLVPLVVMEVQSGSHISKDDVVRLEDAYGRKSAEHPGMSIRNSTGGPVVMREPASSHFNDKVQEYPIHPAPTPSPDQATAPAPASPSSASLLAAAGLGAALALSAVSLMLALNSKL